MDEETIEMIGRVIQNVYGDATQTVLDRQCAKAIVTSMREAGWMPHNEVASILLAAGGKVEIGRLSDVVLPGDKVEVRSWYNLDRLSTTIEARRL